MTLDARVAEALRRHWDIGDAEVVPHDRGMNSRTWLVGSGGRRWVAKSVPAEAHGGFVAGLAVAALVDAAGIPAGAPEPTTDGATWVKVDGFTLALLRFVEGRPLTGDDRFQQRLMGTTLGRAHRALVNQSVTGAQQFHWLDPGAAHLDVEPWVRPAVRHALAGYEALAPDSMTWGPLHSDPAPEAFLFDSRTTTCGLIDWSPALEGPLMYDVASAVMYVGGPERATELADAYLAEGVIQPGELQRTLEPMLRLRWAVQADYFARRLTANDLTGIVEPHENQKGLDDARRALVDRRRSAEAANSMPSRSSAGQVIGGILAGVEHLVTGRPKSIPQIEEQYTDPWASADGITVEGLDEPIDRPEPPDRSGAKL